MGVVVEANELFSFISVLPFSHTLCSEGSDDEGSERRNKQTLTSCMMLFQNILVQVTTTATTKDEDL